MTQQRVAIVSGASEGIGFTVAERLIADGYRVALVARQPEKLAEAAARLGAQAYAVPTDLSSLESIEQAVAEVYRTSGRIDAVVNCASTTRFGTDRR